VAARVISFVTHDQVCGGEKGTSKASSKKAQTDPLLTSSMWQALLYCDIARLELKSSAIFLAIKR
jgi:hypothetical protein